MSAPGRIRLNILLDQEASSDLEFLSNELPANIFTLRRSWVAHHALRIGLAQLRRQGIHNFIADGPPVVAPPPEGGAAVVDLKAWRGGAR